MYSELTVNLTRRNGMHRESSRRSNRSIAALRSSRENREKQTVKVGAPSTHYSITPLPYPSRSARNTFSAVIGRS